MGNCLAKEETEAERRAKEIVEAASAPKPKSSAKPKSKKDGGAGGGGGGGAGGTCIASYRTVSYDFLRQSMDQRSWLVRASLR